MVFRGSSTSCTCAKPVTISVSESAGLRKEKGNQQHLFVLSIAKMLDKTESSSAPIEGELPESSKSYEALLAQGKRNLLCKDIHQALNQLQEASRLVAEKFGETAEECAEVYLHYGMALLELARMENSVLGNALVGIPEEEPEDENVAENTFVEPDNTTEEEKEKISVEVIEAMVEPDVSMEGAECPGEQKEADNLEEAKKIDSEATPQEDKKEDPAPESAEKSEEIAPIESEKESKEEEKAKVEDETKVEEKAGVEEAEVEEKTGEEEAEVEGEEEEESDESADTANDTADEGCSKENTLNTSQEDVSNLQLAWEMIELSRSIYKRDEKRDAKLKQTDCLLRLGEISLETEQYSQAIDDLSECILLLEGNVKESSRRLAETHYQLALAYGYNNNFDEAVSHYNTAIKIIELKIVELQQKIGQGAKEETKTEGSTAESVSMDAAQKEIEELKSLIPEIKIKIDDAKEEKKAQGLKEVIRENFKVGPEGEECSSFEFQGETSASSSSAADAVKPVQNISHLVRKKRKTDDEEVLVNEAKKARTELVSEEVSTAGTKETKTAMTELVSEEVSTAETKETKTAMTELGSEEVSTTETKEMEVEPVEEKVSTNESETMECA